MSTLRKTKAKAKAKTKTSTTGREPLNFDLLLFGATGDLAARKIIPALFERYRTGELHADCRLIGLARQALSHAEFIALIDTKVRSFLAEPCTDDLWRVFINRWQYQCVEPLNGRLECLTTQLRPECVRVVYFATPSYLFVQLLDGLAAAQLISPQTRVVLEKPLGKDLVSAQAINQAVLAYIAESQVYRIDHYLGKEPVQNLLALRFGNVLFEPLWCREWISDVQITLAEDLGLAGRAGYYDGVGALRDMVQNHLLQLLAIIAMEPPNSMDADCVRDEKLKVFKALKPMTPERVAQCVVRGQYASGHLDGKQVVGYTQEEGVPSNSHTETFVAIKAEIDNWRWAGVPFYLRTGKRLAHKTAEIVVRFKPLPTQLLPLSQFNTAGVTHPNRLLIRLQPDEVLQFSLMSKKPGDGMRLGAVNLGLDFDDAFPTRRMEAYERLITDVVRGQLTLFIRADELEAAWQWVDPIIAAWQAQDQAPQSYGAGTWGPASANALMNRDGLLWQEQL
jgi:glucose-6-phosphate 1-dehydrogenase